MSYSVFQWFVLAVYVFAAVMILVRFTFYRRQERTMSSVSFWGGFLFFAMALSDLASSFVYGTLLHPWQILLFLGLCASQFYQAFKQRRMHTKAATPERV